MTTINDNHISASQIKALLYRIDNLEMKVSFLDDTQEQLNAIVTEQSAIIDALHKQIKSMHGKLVSLSESSEFQTFDPATEVPPHF